MKKTILIIASVLSLSFSGMLQLGIASATGGSGSSGSGSTTAPANAAKNQVKSGVESVGGSGTTDAKTLINNIINVMLFLVGVLSVIMIIYGGIQYVISVGDSGKISKAKSTIQYAIVGLVVAILSYAIVNFIVDKL